MMRPVLRSSTKQLYLLILKWELQCEWYNLKDNITNTLNSSLRNSNGDFHMDNKVNACKTPIQEFWGKENILNVKHVGSTQTQKSLQLPKGGLLTRKVFLWRKLSLHSQGPFKSAKGGFCYASTQGLLVKPKFSHQWKTALQFVFKMILKKE